MTAITTGACPTHGDGCAFPGEHPELCPYCHCEWSKITAPATHETTRRYTNSKGVPVVSTITRHLSGYGETKEDHLARHAASEAKRAEATAKEKKKKATADAL